ncbi:MAG TPA: membrane protein insertion efficiency factor YidD [Clostridia bacterium]|nr:membrane protein insertion efficiency factor YidD [Clostridia bacterium]
MKSLLIGALGGYKRLISPMLPHACRFVPTCSEYAIEAVDRHGALRGAGLAFWRLLRCNPFGRSGFDPVPGTSAPLHHIDIDVTDGALRHSCPTSK